MKFLQCFVGMVIAFVLWAEVFYVPYAWAFFVPFILIATFTMLNLFIAIIVSAMQAQTAEEHEEEMVAIEEAHADEAALIQREIGALRSEVAEVRRLLEEKNRG